MKQFISISSFDEDITNSVNKEIEPKLKNEEISLTTLNHYYKNKLNIIIKNLNETLNQNIKENTLTDQELSALKEELKEMKKKEKNSQEYYMTQTIQSLTKNKTLLLKINEHLKKEIENVKRKIECNELNEENVKNIKNANEEIENIKNEIRDLNKTTNYKNKLMCANIKLVLIKENSQKIEDEYNEICIKIENNEKSNLTKNLENEIKQLEIDLKNIRFELMKDYEIVTDSLKSIDQKKKLEQEINDQEKKESLLTLIYEIFENKNGLVSHIMNKKILPIIEIKINMILQILTNFSISIDYDEKQKINMYAVSDNSRLKVSHLSGYEKFACDLAVRLVFNQINKKMRCDCLVIDEVMFRSNKFNKNNSIIRSNKKNV